MYPCGALYAISTKILESVCSPQPFPFLLVFCLLVGFCILACLLLGFQDDFAPLRENKRKGFLFLGSFLVVDDLFFFFGGGGGGILISLVVLVGAHCQCVWVVHSVFAIAIIVAPALCVSLGFFAMQKI